VNGVLFSLLSHFTYLAIVLLLAAAGMGVPISQDLVLLLGGLLASREITGFWPTVAAGYFGAVLGDTLMHRWGQKLGPRAWASPRVQKHLTPERQAKLRRHFEKHGALTIIVGRHTPLVRAIIFFLSGASGVPRWKMVLADAFSAALTIPFWVWLGFKFGEQLPELRKKIHHGQLIAILAAAAVVALIVLIRRQRRPPPRRLPA
jgi:membrane protein DedA with SNARE-associated domain